MSNWKNFLNLQGVKWVDAEGYDAIAFFNDNPTPALDPITQTAIADLGHQQIISIAGPDSAKFLQGQVSCDVNELNDKTTRLGAHCTPKGRMIADFRAALLEENHIALRAHAEAIEALAKSLGKYIIFSKAEIESRSDTLKVLGIVGPEANSLLAEYFGSIPEQISDMVSTDGKYLIKIDEDRFECWLPPTEAESFWEHMAKKCQLLGTHHWDALDIRQGIGQVRGQTIELLIPQMLNMQLIGGINFKKGCYTGQEIVARMHYLGKLKRHMYRASVANSVVSNLTEGNSVFTPGMDLYSEKTKQSVGHVVFSAPVNESTTELLIVCTAQAVEDNNVFIDADKTQKLELLPLPYAITNNQEE